MKMRKLFLPFIFILTFSVSTRAQGCDPWIMNAYKQLYNRNPTAEECNIRNYNNGSWTSYDELVRYVRSYNERRNQSSAPVASCDAWIINAYKQLYNRNPTAEECNIRNYNNGSWTS